MALDVGERVSGGRWQNVRRIMWVRAVAAWIRRATCWEGNVHLAVISVLRLDSQRLG